MFTLCFFKNSAARKIATATQSGKAKILYRMYSENFPCKREIIARVVPQVGHGNLKINRKKQVIKSGLIKICPLNFYKIKSSAQY